MNCKPGDLAILLRAKVPENVGMVVEVLRPSSVDPVGSWICRAMRPRPAARIAPPHDLSNLLEARAKDCDLRPIRDTDGQDESLTWAPSPSKKLEVA